jgi:S-formylglutathione hydrolase FrmB
MAVCEMKLRASKTLSRMTAFNALLPEGVPGPFPVLYLLHGYSDDHTGWVRRSSIERYVDAYPMIVIMPDGQHGWYTDAASLPFSNFDTYITQELVGFVDTMFPTIKERTGRAIAGLSMGGYGALKLALKHPDLFCAGHSFSGAVEIASRRDDGLAQVRGGDENSPWNVENRLIFGASPAGGTEDLQKLVLGSDSKTMPTITFDCGVDDFLIEDNRRFHAFLTEHNVPHVYEEFPGAHEWAYWDTHIQDVLARMAEKFGIERISG